MKTIQFPSRFDHDIPLARVDHLAVQVTDIKQALAGLPKYALVSESPTRAVVRFHNVELALLSPDAGYGTHIGFSKIPIPKGVEKETKHHESDNTVTVSYDAGGLRIESVFR